MCLDDFFYITEDELAEFMYECDRVTCYGCRFSSLCVKYKIFKVVKF